MFGKAMTQQDSRELAFKKEFWRINYPDIFYRDDSLVFTSGLAKIAEAWFISGYNIAQSADTALLQQVREAFTQYANHKPDCLYWNHATGDLCNCGFKKALQRINERLGV